MTDMNAKFNELVGSQSFDSTRPRPADAPSPPVTVGHDGTIAPGVARRAWAEADGVFWGTPTSHKVLPVGVYRMGVVPNLGPAFIKQKNDTDTLVPLPDSESSKVLDEIRAFKAMRESFRSHGFLYKRGILLWGPPGSGKTCTLQMLMKMLMDEHNSVAVLVESPHDAATCLQALRRIEPERQIIAILEDMDALCDRFGESEYLSLLDGESQVDNIVYVATTNYPEKLDRRFVDRPSRFDTIRYIGMPAGPARAVYLCAKVKGLSQTEVRDYIAVSEGYSIAHMRELIILTRCFGFSIKDAAARLNVTRLDKPSSEREPGRQRLGFVG